MRRMCRAAGLVSLLVVAILGLEPAIASATGTVTATTTDVGGGITKIVIDWTSSAGGAVSGNAITVTRGYLLQIAFTPDSGGTQPSDLYDVTLVDPNSIDTLNGLGANLSNASSSVLQWNPAYFLDGSQTLDLVVANAGNAKGGTVTLWVRR